MLMTQNIRSLFLLLLFWTLIFPAKSQNAPASPTKKEANFPEGGSLKKTAITYKIIDAPNKTFGYDIFSDGKLLIHQPSIPGMSGNNGFKSRQSAEKVAQLIVKKVKNGEMPPTVDENELRKLNAIE
jgi:hypothetical protein